MAAQDTAKRGQVSDMKPKVEPIPNLPAPPQDATLAPDLQVQIGRQLRAVYDEVVEEGVPERFLRLLEELERKKSEGL
jgi:Anti-sigma factor NepR